MLDLSANCRAELGRPIIRGKAKTQGDAPANSGVDPVDIPNSAFCRNVTMGG